MEGLGWLDDNPESTETAGDLHRRQPCPPSGTVEASADRNARAIAEMNVHLGKTGLPLGRYGSF